MNLRKLLRERIVFFDGALGTQLQQAGLAPGELPEGWNLSRPETILDIHRQYLQAGCDILETNTFGANRLKFGDTTAQVVAAGVRLARQATGEAGHGYVALSMGPTGRLLQPLGDLPFEEAVSLYAEVARAGEAAGADLILIETMGDTLEAKAAVLAAKEQTGLPVAVTMIFDERGRLLTGGDIPAMVALLEGLGVDALGLNCGLGPEQMEKLLPTLLEYASAPVILNPNAGLPRSENGRTVFDVGPEEFARQMEGMARAGARLLGGCCGTTPAHIAALVARCRDIPPRPIAPKGRTLVSSCTHAVDIGARPVLVGERINPTGKSRFKQALRENDLDYILREGLSQQQNGADILDVNVGLPEIDEPAMMERVVTELQSVCTLPLQIDSSSPAAIERALRRVNGKPLVNSVNGKREVMEQIFPLVQKYGGVVVGLTLDETGIPDSAQGRLAIARRIVETAAQYGIARRDILIDPLTMTISTGADAAKITLQALSLIKRELGVCTILGVSNVSFGLPVRENINAAFFTMALQCGLDAAILNPGSEGMQRAYHAGCALLGKDPQCARYIARYAGQAAAPAPAGGQGEALPLAEAIIRGLRERAGEAAAELVKTVKPLTIISDELVPALDQVGQRYEQGKVFLPQLLMSAEAAKEAFEAIRSHLERTGEGRVKGEKIVLATVRGDIHDIGKNIVKVLLENYGFDVVDLGKDVPPEQVVQAVCESGARLCGLSALMTTTVSSMEETIRALRAAAPGCRVMVGGAVLNATYAAQIGADHYAKDAMGSVHYARELLG